MRRLILFLMVLVGGNAGFAQQPLAEKGPFVLNVDYARFQHDARSVYLEIYYGFYSQLVTLESTNGGFNGGVKLFMQVVDTTTGDILEDMHSLLPVTMTDTSEASLRHTIVTQSGYALPFGDYRLKVVAIDSLLPLRRDSIELPLSLKPYPSGFALSDVELCSEIKTSDRTSEPFYKNSLEVYPNPTLVFGVTNHPVMFQYLELYNLDTTQTYAIKVQVLDGMKNVIRESSKVRTYQMKNAAEVGMMNISSILSGKYQLVILVENAEGQEVGRSQKMFYVYNPHIQPAPVSSIALKESELSGLSSEELAEEFRQAQYVAMDKEIRMFTQLTSQEARREFLAKFWTEVEKGRLGNEPIERTGYLQRVAVANQRFRAQMRDGWHTDRGRVYILYGKPDEVQRFPSQQETKPYEIWRYFRIENSVDFIFVDRFGFGDYQLIHSTKRGELQDYGWQQFLR